MEFMRKSKYPENPKSFGQRIRKLRMDQKLSLMEVAREVGITEGYLSRLEDDKQYPSDLVAEKLTKFLLKNDEVFDLLKIEKLKTEEKALVREIRPYSISLEIFEICDAIAKELKNLPQTAQCLKTKKAILTLLQRQKKAALETKRLSTQTVPIYANFLRRNP